jgi:hypothetical protein
MNAKEEKEETYKSPVTGQTIRVYPTEEDWRDRLKAAGKPGPHWE